MADEPIPTVRVSPSSGSVLAASMAAVGALNTALASFLLGDPFRVGIEEVDAGLTRVRNRGITAIVGTEVASATDELLDLDLVAEAGLETVDGLLWLAVRCLEMARRAGVGPGLEPEVERLQETVVAIAELLPGDRVGR